MTAPHAHARVTRIDAVAALDEAGVVTVLTGGDVPGEDDTGAARHDEPLFPREVMFHRQPVAWVLGETLEAARRGAARVDVDYEPLPAILTIAAGDRSGQLPDRPARGSSRGDMSALDRAPLRLDGRAGDRRAGTLLSGNAVARSRGSTRAAASRCSRPRSIRPRRRRSWRACWAAAHIRSSVECLRMGGAFGGKEVQANPYAAIAALGAWKTGRPVRVRLHAPARHGADRQAPSVSGAL